MKFNPYYYESSINWVNNVVFIQLSMLNGAQIVFLMLYLVSFDGILGALRKSHYVSRL